MLIVSASDSVRTKVYVARASGPGVHGGGLGVEVEFLERLVGGEAREAQAALQGSLLTRVDLDLEQVGEEPGVAGVGLLRTVEMGLLATSALAAVCWAWRLRSEVEVLCWDPDRGNPTLMRQGRGSEFAGRSQCGCLRCGTSVRACLREAVGVSWSRTRVKRRKASFGWVSWPLAVMPCSCRSRGRIGDVIAVRSQRLTPGDLLGSSRLAGRPENERTTVDGPAEVGGSRRTGRRGNAR